MARKRSRKYVGFKRSDRISAEIQRIISTMIIEELSDPRIFGVSITGVEMSPDNWIAKVYISLIGSEEKIKDAIDGLTSASGIIKRKIADALRVQHTPDLRFFHDPTMERAAMMEKLFKEINSGEADPEPDDE